MRRAIFLLLLSGASATFHGKMETDTTPSRDHGFLKQPTDTAVGAVLDPTGSSFTGAPPASSKEVSSKEVVTVFSISGASIPVPVSEDDCVIEIKGKLLKSHFGVPQNPIKLQFDYCAYDGYSAQHVEIARLETARLDLHTIGVIQLISAKGGVLNNSDPIPRDETGRLLDLQMVLNLDELLKIIERGDRDRHRGGHTQTFIEVPPRPQLGKISDVFRQRDGFHPEM